MKTKWDIIVIGGGASGYFAAIEAAKAGGGASIAILEKTTKLLSKVSVSGGGRCNVTHDCPSPDRLVKRYPRGGRTLRRAFVQFGTRETVDWFKNHGVNMKVEEDGRMFPITDRSSTVIECLTSCAERANIKVFTQMGVTGIEKTESDQYRIKVNEDQDLLAHKVIVAMGGHPKSAAYDWLRALGLQVRKPVPSLFTFNIPDFDLTEMAGLSVQEGGVRITGTKWMQEGPVLITHWGLSAPAVIRLSAWAAEDLHAKDYKFQVRVNWCNLQDHEVVDFFRYHQMNYPKQVIRATRQLNVPSRLWAKLCDKAGIDGNLRYHSITKKHIHRLSNLLTGSEYIVKGKTTFKEEFVTCGGVSLNEVDLDSFESKKHSGLYLVGEVLNVDGITGGFNFQHAWTSGYLAGHHAGEQLTSSPSR